MTTQECASVTNRAHMTRRLVKSQRLQVSALNRTLYRYMEMLYQCLALFLKSLALYVACWCAWGLLLYFRLSWFLHRSNIGLSPSWHEGPKYFFALINYPPLIPVVIWLLFVAVRSWRRRPTP